MGPMGARSSLDSFLPSRSSVQQVISEDRPSNEISVLTKPERAPSIESKIRSSNEDITAIIKGAVVEALKEAPSASRKSDDESCRHQQMLDSAACPAPRHELGTSWDNARMSSAEGSTPYTVELHANFIDIKPIRRGRA